ncbi:MAG: hypothetical protein U9R25_11800, partial [Chloroflexota bacterium]|nr:hypothetical protein [Chloroflexota bacterium]
AQHSVNLFQPAIDLTKTGDELSKIGDPVDYTITLDNNSSPDTPNLECRVTDALVGVDEIFTVVSGASHVINVTDFPIPVGAADPFVNTAEVICSPVGFLNEYDDTAQHSVNLFQPAIDLTKTASHAYSKAGDDITYTIEIVNNSSADSPDLILYSFQDTLVPGVTPLAACSPLAADASCTFSYTYTVQPGDPDPLVNTATAVYNPDGFLNEISGSGAASVDLLHPDYTLSKTCAEDPIFVGSIAVFDVVLENTGDVDLIVTLDEDVMDGDGTVIPAGTSIDLAQGETLTFYVEIPNAPYPSVSNTISAVATLPAWTGLPNEIERSSSDTCTVSYWAFTPGFWKTHGPGTPSDHNAWVYTAFNTSDLLGDVFDSAYLTETPRGFTDPFSDLNLMNALSFKGGPRITGAKEILLRAGVAALLNASFHETLDVPEHPAGVAVHDSTLGRDVLMSCDPNDPGCTSPIVYYPYTVQGVIDAVNSALGSGNRMTILTLASELDGYNNGIHYIDWDWPWPGMPVIDEKIILPPVRGDEIILPPARD